MTGYLYIFGRTPELAFVELHTFLSDVMRVGDGVAISEHVVPINKLGGTIKIAHVIGNVTSPTAESLAPFIDSSTFGLSNYKSSRTLLEGIKKILSETGKHVRFVESKNGNELSSVVIQKQHVQDYVLVQTKDGYLVGKTIEVQPFEEWNARDYGRPYADPKAGMLPPKVSRMVVNIADRRRNAAQSLSQKTLLDPFCGMGTILSEALVMGWNVVGGDQSADVVEKARKNLKWLMEKHSDLGVTYRLNVVDAVHVSGVVDKESIDAIVTEPYLGNASIKYQVSSIKNTIKGLEKLYIGCLREWVKILKPQGVVMMALPMYQVEGKTYFVKKVIDMCETLGYTIETGPIEYSRPGATVKRMFYLFQKIST
jgi:tRNA G10  N-methylase Trm11